MNKKPFLIISFVVIASVLMIVGGFFTLGGLVNTGASIPRGLYIKIDKPLAIGRYVIFCPPNRPDFQTALQHGLIDAGNCPDGFAKMMLKVVAKRKNVVTINEEGVFVNDSLLPSSRPLSQDKAGQLMAKLVLDHYELKENEVLLMSNSPDVPFDGRYFGIIDVEQIDSVISPLF